jgi:hypothetical protein
MDYYGSTWERPNDWLVMPTVEPTDQIVAVLFGIDPDNNNRIAFQFRSAYHVDWGDGTTTTHAWNEVAQKTYLWDDISDKTLTTEGFKQVLIVITPQAGFNLTMVHFSHTPTGLTVTQHQKSLVLDLLIHGLHIDTITPFGFKKLRRVDVTVSAARTDVRWSPANHDSLQYWKHKGGTLTSFGWFFWNCHSLDVIDIDATVNISGNAQQGFESCYALTEIPAGDWSGVTDTSNTFRFVRCLRRSKITGMRISHSYADSNISAAGANEIYTNLADLNALELPGATITMTGNPLTGHDTTIATDKGWTVHV